MKVIGIIGWKNSGKTFFAQKIINKLTQKGINVEFCSVSDANHFFSNSEKELKKVLNKYIQKESALY